MKLRDALIFDEGVNEHWFVEDGVIIEPFTLRSLSEQDGNTVFTYQDGSNTLLEGTRYYTEWIGEWRKYKESQASWTDA